MKNDLKISTLAIICVLCTAVSGAYAASSVRSLGGSGTYTSASSAATANSDSSSGSSSVRGGSVRVNPTSGVSGTSATVSAGTTTSGRVATTPRLSIGQYLGSATSVSGGSSLRPQTPSDGTSSSGGDSSLDPDVAAGLRQEVDQLQRDVESLRNADDDVRDQLLDKQDTLIPGQDGYIIIDDNTNEIFVDVDSLQDALETVAGQDGREIELGSNDTDLLWRYVGDSAWNILISKAEITGPQGPQGEKGEPGDAANLEAYSTTAQMNSAISAAIDALADVYATKAELAGYAKSVDLERGLANKANAADVYTKSEVYNKQEVDDKVANVVAGDMDEALKDYVKTDALNTALDTKANTTYVDSQLATKADVSAVNALETEVDAVAQTAGGAASLADQASKDAASALSGLADKQDKLSYMPEDSANKSQSINDSTTEYPSSAAVYGALEQKADKSELADYAKTEDLAGYATTESVDTKLENYYTISEVDNKVSDIVAGDMSEALTGKEDVSNKTQTVVDDETKYPSSAAVYKELETKAFKSDLDNYATKEELGQKADKTELDGFATTEDLAGFATTEQLDAKADKSELAGYATKSDLDSKADQAALDSVSQNVTNITQQISDPESGLTAKVDSAVAAAGAAETAATEAKTAAEKAQTTADEAKDAAGQAQTAADQANAALAGKQDKLSYTPEDSANKATAINDGNRTSSTEYPSIGAVTEWTEQRINELSTEGIPVNPDDIGTGAITEDKLSSDSVSTVKIQDGAVTEDKLSTELQETIADKVSATSLGSLAYENSVTNANIAADAGIEKSKLAADVQATLDNAVTTTEAGENKILGTDENGDKVWYTIAMQYKGRER